MKHIKCPHCGAWSEGNHIECPHCGKVFDEERNKERSERAREGHNIMRLVEIKENDGMFQRFWKRPFRIGQLVFYTVVSIIAAIASSTVH